VLVSLDLHKLEIFVTIARLSSFTHAADRLHMTQPTVSQQLAMLEAQIGTPLIERDTRRLRLTPAGEALLPYAEKLLALSGEAAEVTRAAAGLADRSLRLGVGHILATYLLPGLLSRFQARFPGHTVRITVGNTGELLTLLASEAAELALIGFPAEHPDILATPFMQDHLVVIVAPDDPWAARSEVELKELRGRTLLTREAGSALHATIERLLGESNFSSDSTILLGETEAIKRSVEAGLGIALIQGIAVEREVAAGNLRRLKLLGGDDSRTYAYARHRRHELSSAARNLVTLLREWP
jgi:DNA-binding transcriptional LysR family regulator